MLNCRENPCGGSHVATLGSARRRRERTRRSLWRRELVSIKMTVLCATYHFAQQYAHVGQGVQVGVPWILDFELSEASDESPVIEYVAPTLAVTPDESTPVTEYVASAPAVTSALLTRVLLLSTTRSLPRRRLEIPLMSAVLKNSLRRNLLQTLFTKNKFKSSAAF